MKCAVLLSCALLGLSACSRRAAPPAERCAEIDAGTPIDPLLLAFLSRARAAHHLADAHESAGELAQATRPLADLVKGPLPRAGGELAPEVHEVLADTEARLADLRSRSGAFEQALADIAAGLEHAREPNYFRGHLLETEGLVEERHAQSLEKSDPDRALALRKRAIGLLEQAMAVQAGVLEAAPRSSSAPSGSGASPLPAASTP
jgi:tetratricopeptide (TPR) repeat protein